MASRTLINPLPKNSGVSLRATIQNPRPRKYASDADRQKAFRERQAVIQVRVKPETVETFDRIATTLGYSRQEVVYALLMSGLNNNRNWQQTGIPAFRLPRYEENPIMRKATPAQLAARERFAEMARSGAFKRKAKKNPAKKTSARSAPGPGDKTVYKRYTIVHPTSGDWFYIVRDGVNIGGARSVQEAKNIIDMLTEGLPNPAEAKERKPRVVLITNPKQRMGLIAFRTAGGALTTKEVPILFSFKLPVAANLYGEKSTMDFFAHKDGREIAVTEKTTGFKLGNIPRVFMAVGRDEKAAAKYFVEDLLKQHGAAKFRAAVESKPKIA